MSAQFIVCIGIWQNATQERKKNMKSIRHYRQPHVFQMTETEKKIRICWHFHGAISNLFGIQHEYEKPIKKHTTSQSKRNTHIQWMVKTNNNNKRIDAEYFGICDTYWQHMKISFTALLPLKYLVWDLKMRRIEKYSEKKHSRQLNWHRH